MDWDDLRPHTADAPRGLIPQKRRDASGQAWLMSEPFGRAGWTDQAIIHGGCRRQGLQGYGTMGLWACGRVGSWARWVGFGLGAWEVRACLLCVGAAGGQRSTAASDGARAKL